MNAPTRVVAYTAGCAVLFAGALGVGRAVGPVASEPAEAADHAGMAGTATGDTADHGGGVEDTHHEDSATGEAAAAGHGVAGLEATSGGYTLRLVTDAAAATRGPLRFQVLGPDGGPVTDYEEEHEKDLHLVVVRRDLTGFQHVHPVLDAAGTWSVPVDLTPGAWRVLADFHPTGGDPQVLGADLLVPGDFAPEPLGDDSSSSTVDGYDVTLARELVAPGSETVLTATVSRGGVPVDDLQPYLGAYGHLVSLRDGDVGYLHVHPEEASGAGPAISFRTTFPTAGRYRLFLDFRHGDVVRTAEFTVTVGGDGAVGHTEDGDHDH